MAVFCLLIVLALILQAHAIFGQEKEPGPYDKLSELTRSLDEDVVYLRRSLKMLEHDNVHLTIEVDKLLVDNDSKRNLLVTRPEAVPAVQTFYGFTAYASAERGYSAGDRVTFDGLVANYGGAYNPATSTFTCPVTGHYYFDLNIYLSNRRDFGVSIAIGTINLTKIYINAGVDDDVRGSTAVVVQCQAGTAVTVICRDAGDVEGNLDAETSFSGFLIST